MPYVVTAPYVTIKVPTTSGPTLVGYFVNAVLPEGADEEAVARLLRKGMIADTAAKVAVEAEPEQAPGGRPKDYAPKPEWVEYAVTRRVEGVSEDEARAAAEAKSKADLIAEHGN